MLALIQVAGDDIPLDQEENKIFSLLFPPKEYKDTTSENLNKSSISIIQSCVYFKYIIKFIIIFGFFTPLVNNRLINIILPNLNIFLKIGLKTSLLLFLLSFIDKN